MRLVEAFVVISVIRKKKKIKLYMLSIIEEITQL